MNIFGHLSLRYFFSSGIATNPLTQRISFPTHPGGAPNTELTLNDSHHSQGQHRHRGPSHRSIAKRYPCLDRKKPTRNSRSRRLRQAARPCPLLRDRQISGIRVSLETLLVGHLATIDIPRSNGLAFNHNIGSVNR